MDIINLCEHNSLVGQFMSEIRDKNLQQERLRFRTNIQRLGQIMAYEISKKLQYNTIGIETPLGMKQCNVLGDRVVLATILRAGLPFHEGFLTGQVFHSLAFAPAGHSVDEGVNDLGIIDEVDVAETCLFLARALVAHVVDDAGDASHGFAVAIGHVVNSLAEVKCRVLVGPQRVQLVGDQRGYKILAVAIQRVDGEVHKLEQIALGGLELLH